jgi:hypothetical protein
MAAITGTSIRGVGAQAATITTLGASDTLTYNAGKSPILILDNVTGGALTPNIDGDGGTTLESDELGSVDVSGGLTLASIGAGDTVALRLNTINAYLQGIVTVTGGTGIEAILLEF